MCEIVRGMLLRNIFGANSCPKSPFICSEKGPKSPEKLSNHVCVGNPSTKLYCLVAIELVRK